MSTPAKVDVGDDTRDILGALAMGDPDLLAAGLEVRADWKARSRLDDRSYALVKLAALIALDAPPCLIHLAGRQRDSRRLPPRRTSWAC